MSIKKCPDCTKILGAPFSSCSCGWVAAVKPEDKKCMAKGCDKPYKIRLGKYWYCHEHELIARHRMHKLTPSEQRLAEMVPVIKAQQKDMTPSQILQGLKSGLYQPQSHPESDHAKKSA